jgi:hypothetical protein
VCKKGDKTDCNKYMGISLLPTTYKILSNSLLSMLIPYARKLLGIINVDFDAAGHLLTIYCAFIKYWRKMGIQRSSASAFYRLQESL